MAGVLVGYRVLGANERKEANASAGMAQNEYMTRALSNEGGCEALASEVTMMATTTMMMVSLALCRRHRRRQMIT